MEEITMPRLRIFAVLIVAFFAVPCATPRANAQSEPSAETLQAAKDLVAVISVDTIRQMSQGMTNQIWPQIERGLRSKRPDIDQSTLTELRTEFENIQMHYMADAMAGAQTVVAKYFTATELRDMLAYHKSPTGQKALKLMPQVMTEFMATLMPQMQSRQAQIFTMFQEVLRKKGIDL
jgi:uncharacterized protein